MTHEYRYELKLAGGGSAEWTGADGESAARRYVDAHHEATVVAFRLARSETHGVFVLSDASQIIG